MPDATTRPTGTADRLRDLESLTESGLAHLDVEDLLSELLDRTLEALGADTAAVLLLDASGEQLVATAARGIEDEVYQGVRIPLGRGFAGRIAAEVHPVVIDDIDTADVFNPVLREKGLRSLLGVPLVVAGRTLGVMHVGTLTPRKFTDADVEMLRTVAERVALTTQAFLSEGERKAAHTLQRSFLPERLPGVPGLEFALRYSAGGEGDVGGDWYDVFVLPSRWVCITVGDVVGRGLHAAVIMGRARTALRSAALALPPDPAAILEQVDNTLQYFEGGEMATAVVALVEPSLRQVHISLAGHPAPILAVEGAESSYLQVPVDPPLGVTQSRHRQATAVALPPGGVMCFYTDGLVERRGASMAERLGRLCDVVTAAHPESVCIQVMASLVGRERPADDVALLVMRRGGAVAAPLAMTLPAKASSLGDIRAALRRWLGEAGATRADEVDVLLAAGEATSNVVEHAYGPEGGQLRVQAELDGDTAVITVSDDGRWRAPRGSNRGRGTHLMQAASDELRVDRREDGTDVMIRRRLGRSTS
jgi:anti-sigma regulatory factor (Ser/Thr protein kinase)/putative methionine-R-sulfoxide reductase with GAF domain